MRQPDRLGRILEQLSSTGSVAVACRGGGRSSRAVDWLTQQGYDVANLDGGMKAWQAAGKPMVADGDAAPDVR